MPYVVDELLSHPDDDEMVLYRDAKFLPVSGCIIGTLNKTNTLEKRSELADTKTATHATEVDDMWDRFEKKRGNLYVEVEDDGLVKRCRSGHCFDLT